MAQLIPDDLTRLSAVALVSSQELQHHDPARVLRETAESLAWYGVQKLIERCIRIDTPETYPLEPKVLRLDVYLITPNELLQLIARARKDGFNDANRWHPMGMTFTPNGE